jgi:beta-galactosidase
VRGLARHGARQRRTDPPLAATEATPGLQGGFIWEFWDHGILQHVSDGRPARRAGAGLYDNGVAAPGHHWAYGGGFGETVHDGAFLADGVVLPDRTPEPVMYEHHGIAAPVRIDCFKHEGIVLVNHQRFRGLDWLSGRWELVLADGRTLTAPADLPDLRPGETAAVPLPFELPRDGGDAWLTLRVTAGKDEPWAPRGTEVCAPRVRLRMAPEPVDDPVAELPVEVDAEGLLVHPLLAAAPTLSLWRAPTGNDELGGVASRREAWRRDALVRKVVSVQRDGARTTVLAEYAGTIGVVRHRQVFTPVEGGIRINEQAELPEEFDDVARVGSVFETVAGPDLHVVQRPMLSAPDASGLTVVLDEPRQVSVTLPQPSAGGIPIRAEDLHATAHHDESEPRSGHVVHVHATHRGLGTASRVPDTSPANPVAPGVHRWSWTLRAL